ncbi:MAG: hypothetical protein HYT66_01200 [Candidatus Yanofskybacteria bacterium]|nr:hypothetical protein [Candidatus Yanofskybacteria bacterium]MBI4120220.1 hypothetical protein [Parcubacteria group bacterium]
MTKKDFQAAPTKKLKKIRTSKIETPELVAEPISETVSESTSEPILGAVLEQIQNQEQRGKLFKVEIFRIGKLFRIKFPTLLTRPILIWAIAMAVGLSVFYWYGYSGPDKNPEETARKEVIQLLADVSELIVLPSNEIPIVATVNDPVKLTNQPFFTKAKAGDKVLIYPNNRRAILYSPVDKKIIEVAPLNVEAPN